MQQLLHQIFQITPKRTGNAVLKKGKLKSTLGAASRETNLKVSPQNAKQQTEVAQVLLCADSLHETVRNFGQNRSTISADFQLAIKDEEVLKGSFLLKRTKMVVRKPNPWQISYKSEWSFNENRNMDRGIINSLVQNRSFPYSLQIRGFKTERSYEAEIKRNPTMSSRLKDVFSEYKLGVCNQGKINGVVPFRPYHF